MYASMIVINPVFAEDIDKLRLIVESAKFDYFNHDGYQYEFIKYGEKKKQLETETYVFKYALSKARFNVSEQLIKEE